MWGEAALEQFNGMWAFAWMDLNRKRLLLSRDRVGEKPLYYYRSAQSLFFASEIKGILAGSRERFAPNLAVIARYIGQSLLDAQDDTFFEGIQSVPAGHNLSLHVGRAGALPIPRIQQYWLPPIKDEFEGNISSRIEQIRETFSDAVAIRMRSDVTVGAMLSGGIGSSSIAGGMRQILGKDGDLHLISAVSHDKRFSEEPFIDLMTAHLKCGTDKLNWYPSGREAFRLLESAIYFNDEPIGDFSTVNHLLLMERAKNLGIKVLLSGQGDDELLCGYRKYLGFYAQQLIRNGDWYKAAKLLGLFCARGTLTPRFNIADARRYLPNSFLTKGIDLRGPKLRNNDFNLDIGLGEYDVVSRQVADLVHYSIPSQCHGEDRMSMAHSIEIRLPFLDFRLIKMLLPLAPEWKLRDGWTKWIFRKAQEHLMPASIAWRKDKMGFDNPQSEWLKKEFKDTVETIMRGDLLVESSGLVNRTKLLQTYRDYCCQRAGRGIVRYQDFLHPLALELWLRRFESNLSIA